MKRAGTTKVAKPSGSSSRAGGVGYKRYDRDARWLPAIERPSWLDGSLPGDRGFDPLGLSKPTEFIQYDLDSLDQNKPVNLKGEALGVITPKTDEVSTDRFQPYSEVFGLQRFRECELIHGRWCMLATLGCFAAEGVTGVPWQEAGKKILDEGPSYFGLGLPFSITQLVWIEVILVGGAELYRNTELDPEKRCYPGGYFDPLNFASGDPERVFRLKEAEIKHGRLAMIAFLGFSVQALVTGQGVFGSLKQATGF
eukprot:g6521.t1